MIGGPLQGGGGGGGKRDGECWKGTLGYICCNIHTDLNLLANLDDDGDKHGGGRGGKTQLNTKRRAYERKHADWHSFYPRSSRRRPWRSWRTSLRVLIHQKLVQRKVWDVDLTDRIRTK